MVPDPSLPRPRHRWRGLSASEVHALAAADLREEDGGSVRRVLLARQPEQAETVAFAGRAAAGDPVAAALLRGRLLEVAGGPGDLARIAAGVLAASTVATDDRPDDPEDAAQDEHVLVAGAVAAARSDAEALAFLALVSAAVRDARQVRALLTSVRRPPRDGAPRVLTVPEPGGPLRPPVGLPDVLPPPVIRWPLEEDRRLPDLVFPGGDCLALLSRLLLTATALAPTYLIEAVSPDDACVGAVVTLRGSGFGTAPGRVAFTGVDGGSATAVATSWSDGEIVVVVPAGATGGPLGLAIEAGEVTGCAGVRVPYFRRGGGAGFAGGVPRVLAVGFEPATEGVVDGDLPVALTWTTAPPARPGEGSGGVTAIVVDEAGREVVRAERQPGGPGRLLVPAERAIGPTAFRGTVTVVSGCGRDDGHAEVRVARRSGLLLSRIELTQAIQSPLAEIGRSTLVADRAVTVRAFLRRRTGAGWASDGGTPVEVTLDGAGPQQRLVVQAAAAAVASDPAAAATFTIPAARVTPGRLDVTVAARPLGLPAAMATTVVGRTGLEVDLPRRGRRVVVVRLSHPALGLPAPTVEQLWSTWRGAVARLPLGSTQWRLVTVPSAVTMAIPAGTRLLGSTATDPAVAEAEDERVAASWSALREEVRDAALAADLDAHDLVLGLLPSHPGYLLNGLATHHRGEIGSLLSQVGLPATLAHELAHGIDVRHTDFTTGDPPERPDPAQPYRTGNAGWDAAAARPVAAQMPCLMSYADPAALPALEWVPPGGAWTYQDRWPTQVLWDHRLKGRV